MSKILPCPNCKSTPILHYADIKYFTGSQFWGARYFRYICPTCHTAGYPKTEYKGVALRYWNAIASGKKSNFATHLSKKEIDHWFPVTIQKERPFGVCSNEEKEFDVQSNTN